MSAIADHRQNRVGSREKPGGFQMKIVIVAMMLMLAGCAASDFPGSTSEECKVENNPKCPAAVALDAAQFWDLISLIGAVAK